MPTSIRHISFPRTQPPPSWIAEIAGVFIRHEPFIGTTRLAKGLTSDAVLTLLRDELVGLGFAVEASKLKADKIKRPVFFGENGVSALNYEIDAFHPGWECGLEIEAGRAWMGNAIYRDLIQGLVMVQVSHLVLAVPNGYKYQSGGKMTISSDYENTRRVADTLYSHTRFRFPYNLTVIGY